MPHIRRLGCVGAFYINSLGLQLLTGRVFIDKHPDWKANYADEHDAAEEGEGQGGRLELQGFSVSEPYKEHPRRRSTHSLMSTLTSKGSL